MSTTRTITEYRVLIRRRDNPVKDWRSRSLKAVERRIGILTSDEPWRFFGDREMRAKGPTDYVCCAGTMYDECGCGGLTMQEDTNQKRAHLPPIDSIEVQSRRIVVAQWEPMQAPVPVAMYPCDECASEHATTYCPQSAKAGA